jgi:uncharacterized membrane protein
VPEPNDTICWLPVAHHRRTQLERCLLIGCGRRRLAICARCAALYPVLFLALLAQLSAPPFGFGSTTIEWLIAVLGVAPALVDWALARLRIWSGTNLSRVLTGAVAGLALGRTFALYLRDPYSLVFWVQILLIIIIFVAVEITRHLQLDE